MSSIFSKIIINKNIGINSGTPYPYRKVKGRFSFDQKFRKFRVGERIKQTFKLGIYCPHTWDTAAGNATAYVNFIPKVWVYLAKLA